ncbi:hypothetical protein ACQHMI_25705, partial [Escherichia coli]|uniref:hypothetical protein n=1 Tax=Escherichia coli TaxID=562 RepID=UPI003CE716F5
IRGDFVPHSGYIWQYLETFWRRKWQPTPVFLPGESHGQRSLVGYSPWSCKELNVTEQLTLLLFFSELTKWQKKS